MRLFGRACLSIAFVSAVLVAGAGACIPDPKGEFEDYKARVANLGGETVTTDASVDTKPPETAVEALYVGICYASKLVTNPEQTLKFYTKTKFVPDGSGGGKISLEVHPMLGWANGDYTNPKTASLSETRGDAVTLNDVPVASGAGRFTANLGTLKLDPEANSLSGRAAIINNAVLDGRFGDPEFCTLLGGQLVVPYEYTFVPSENICLFSKVNEGDPMPVRKPEEFACPL
jgi:hypothetical protein